MAEERFWPKVEKTEGCWIWKAGTNGVGYGYFGLNNYNHKNEVILAHRFSYELLKGPIPQGLELDHLCRNRLCVNPAHLEIVTRRENVLRGESIAAKNAVKQFCKNGHPLSGDNLVAWAIKRGMRMCKTCRYAAFKRWRARQKK